MTIELIQAGKHFDGQWIFKDLSFVFQTNYTYAIIGLNGSGKSTLLKTIAGMITPNSGTVKHTLNNKLISPEDALLNASYCSPFMELPEELTVGELLEFHATQVSLNVSINHLLAELKLSETKFIRTLSSGMKQRLKLALAVFTESYATFLDEPTSNFDAYWEDWYKEVVRQVNGNRLLVISSNHPPEYQDFAVASIGMSSK